MNTDTKRKAILALLAGAFLSGPIAAANPEPKIVEVNCSNGKTLAKALERGNEDRPLLVLVQGVCNETVTIERADVTLRGEAGGAINGPDPVLDTLTVRADRVSIENLVVSGGKNGIVASGATSLVLRGSMVQATGRTGVILVAGASAIMDGSTVQSNPRDGVTVDGSQLTMINSTVRQNARIGVFIGTGAAGRIGVDNVNNPGGNLITQNGSSGIAVNTSGGAIIGNNNITFNGADPAAPTGRFGIAITSASADIIGGNTVADNSGVGIFMRGASVQIGNATFGPSSVNTITGNGDALSQGGVFAFLGSTLVVRDAVISGNRGFGLGFGARSQGQVFNSQISNNVPVGPNPVADGIRISQGSAALFSTPASVATGHSGWGLVCTDAESSVGNTAAVVLDGNAIAGTNCTGF